MLGDFADGSLAIAHAEWRGRRGRGMEVQEDVEVAKRLSQIEGAAMLVSPRVLPQRVDEGEIPKTV